MNTATEASKLIRTLFIRCVICGKLTKGGRLPRLPWGRHDTGRVGDGTFRFPRRHKGPDGQPCPGNVEEGRWEKVQEESSSPYKNGVPHAY